MEAFTESAATLLAIPKGFRVTPEQFEQLAYVEQLARLELTQDGELIVMSPTGGEAGSKNRRLTQQIGIWTDRDGTGEAFDSSTMFILPNGARRSPDVSWMKLERWNALTLEIYRSGQQVEILNNPQTLSGEDVLPGFILDLTEIFFSI
jgi:Uma2 family endonuclease